MNRPAYEVKAEFFKTLSHPIRIRILEVLRHGPLAVSEIADEIGVGGSALSQHLAVLRRMGILTSHRVNRTVIHQTVDPRIFELLAIAKQIVTTSLKESQELLDDLERLDFDTHSPRLPTAG
jgi:ArsR family transcriptional regulator